MGVLLEGFFFGPGRVTGVPSPLDGDHTLPFWWDHLAAQARQLATSGFTAIWLPPTAPSWSPLNEIAPSRVRTWSPAGVSEVSVHAPREE